MTGYYSLPLLVRESTILSGFIPVAPVGHEIISRTFTTCSGDHQTEARIISMPEYFRHQLKSPYPNLSCIETPTLVVYGENDRSYSSALLSLLPNSKGYQIPNGDHPAYLKNPTLFHTILYNFLKKIDHFNSKQTSGAAPPSK